MFCFDGSDQNKPDREEETWAGTCMPGQECWDKRNEIAGTEGAGRWDRDAWLVYFAECGILKTCNLLYCFCGKNVQN